MKFQKYIFNDKDLYIYNEYIEKARAFDKDGSDENLPLAYNLYLKASAAHISYAEQRLGSMTINGDGTEADFHKGVGYYIMAAEDGDDYSRKMVSSLFPYIASGVNILSILDGAKRGNKDDLMKLGATYLRCGKHYYRALEIFAKKALIGDGICAYNVADILIAMDNDFYSQNPDKTELYYQDDNWINLAKNHFNNPNIYREKLVVNSKNRISDVFDVFKYLLIKHGNDSQIVDMVINGYVQLVNKTNSFQRK